jgi:CheY-like chemotaxis protein
MTTQDYNILLIEDDATTNKNMKQLLERYGYRVAPCLDIYEANDYWNKYKNSIKCIVTDLNIVANGLSERYKKESVGGLFTGWLWLWDKVFSSPERKSLPLKKVIILTAYQNSLDKYVKTQKDFAQKDAYDKDTFIIAKGDPDDAQKILISKLEKLEVR